MGIKTRFNPMGGRSVDKDKGNLSLWRYSNDVIAGKTLLYNYLGSDWANTLYVPKVKGKTIINDWYNVTSGTKDTNRNTPFYNNPNVTSVDLQGVPFRNNSMYNAFYNCRNLTFVNNISNSVTNMYYTFYHCNNLNQNIKIPNSVTNMGGTFQYCNNLNQNIKIPNSVTSMGYTFPACYNLNQNIQIPNSVTTMDSTFLECYNLNQNIKIPNSVTTMDSTFYQCGMLNQNIQIPNSVTRMGYTFLECYNLNQNIKIPNSVTTMVSTFYHCNNLNQNIKIPNSVTNMGGTFQYCHNLNQNIKIPNSVTTMGYTFRSCYNLNQNIKIPNSVTNMVGTFYHCNNLNQNIQIPNSVTNMDSTFYHCNNLNQNIKIPNSVTNMDFTFSECFNLNSWINIHSANITSMSDCFNVNNASSVPNVFIIRRYINNALTATYNSLKSAGWTWNDVNIVGGTGNKVRCWSLGWSNYANVNCNGTHVFLNKWHGHMDTFINNNTAVVDVKVPEYLTIGGDPLNYQYPSALSRTCFQANTAIKSLDLGTDIPWVDNAIGTGTNTKNRNAACHNCFNLQNIKAVINNDVTDASALFDKSYNLTEAYVVFPDTITKYYVSYEGTAMTDFPPFGSGATNLQSCFYDTVSMVNCPVIPPNVQSLGSTFMNVFKDNLEGNVFILSPAVSNINSVVQGYTTTTRKNIYIPFTYSNEVNTATYNAFKANNVFKGTSGNGTGVNPMYNSTSNFYIYNLSANFSQIWSSTSGTTYTSLLKYNDAINTPHMAVFAQYPDYNVSSIGNNCFNGSRNLRSLALYSKPWNSASLYNAFRGCYNLRIIQGLNLIGITDLSHTFDGCQNLRVMRNIPATVTNMAYTFYSCYNLNFNVQILGNNVTTMSCTFYLCNNLNQNIKIPNSVTTMDSTFYQCGMLNQNIKIPNSVTNMDSTFYHCHNLNQNIKIPNSVTNMYFTFQYCHNLNQNIQIPNSVTTMGYTFSSCFNLNQNIKIPNSVTSMGYTFYLCNNLQGRLDISSTELANSYQTFWGANASKPKDVYIYYKYANGVNTKTYNLVVANTNANYKWHGQNGVTVHDLGSAPW